MCSLEITWSAPPMGSEAERRLEMYLVWSASADACSLSPAPAAGDAMPESCGEAHLGDVNYLPREKRQAIAT